MRIDGGQTAGVVTRSSRAVTPFRESRSDVAARSAPSADREASSSQELQAPTRRVPSSAALSGAGYLQQGLSARALQALASYGDTASYTEASSAQYVLGIDLYV